MVPQPPTSSIVLLTRLARVVYRASTEDLLGMKLKNLAVLAHLRDHGSMSQQALSSGLCVDANTCVLFLNDCEASGWVQRRRDPSDRRRHIVEITPAGLDALLGAEAAQSTIEDEVLARLDEEARETLQQLLRQALEDTPAELTVADING